MKQRFEEIRLALELPSPSRVGLRILKLLGRGDLFAEDLTEAINYDGALSSRILKMTNSGAYRLRGRLTSVEHAGLVLGQETLHSIALGFSVIASNRYGGCEGFDADKFWRLSLSRAIAAQEIAKHLHFSDTSSCFACGLLGDVGQLGLAMAFPMDYPKILKTAGRGLVEARLSAEKRHLGIQHREMTRELLTDWALSEDQVEAAVRGSEDPYQPLPERARDLTLILRLGKVMSFIWNQDVEPDVEYDMWCRTGGHLLNLDRASFDHLRRRVMGQSCAMLQLAGIETDTDLIEASLLTKQTAWA